MKINFIMSEIPRNNSPLRGHDVLPKRYGTNQRGLNKGNLLSITYKNMISLARQQAKVFYHKIKGDYYRYIVL